MLKSKAIRKIFVTTITMFILLTVFSIPMLQENNLVPVNLELEEVSGISTNSIYLMNKSGYLVKAHILLDEEKTEDKVLKILNNLKKKETSRFSNGLAGTIPENIKINEVICGSELVTIDFSKEFLSVDVSMEKDVAVYCI